MGKYKYADWALCFAFVFACLFSVDSTLLLCLFAMRLIDAVDGLRLTANNTFTVKGDLSVINPSANNLDITGNCTVVGEAKEVEDER